MCGITGIFDTHGTSAINTTVLHAMNDSQAHRGPDEQGVFIEPGIGLGHRRLSIIDLSTGQQPMRGHGDQIVLVYNGEIYNFLELRKMLEDVGYRFRTHSDTEVVINAWVEWGEACVTYFRGMFAFALYDKRTQALFLARDRLGVKPLHYACLANGSIIFGSELKPLLLHPEVHKSLDVHALDGYFTLGYIPDPLTIIQGIKKLPAAHTLLIKRGQGIPAPKSYWDIQFQHTISGSEEELAQECASRVRECVRMRLMSEVPLGAFLSGGVDSSAVVAMMSLLSGQSVKTCSIGFDRPDYDETAYAQKVAWHYDTDHHHQSVVADDFSLMDTIAQIYVEPFADASALPTYRVCALARQHVTVALSGDGGDEFFAGYSRYRFHMAEDRIRSYLPAWFRRPVFGGLGAVYPKMDWAPKMFRARTTLHALGLEGAEAYVHSVSRMRQEVRLNLLTQRFRSGLQGYDTTRQIAKMIQDAPADDALSKIQYADIKTWLPGDILTKIDRASMAVGLEAREPLLDHTLLEWTAKLAPDLRLRGGVGKYIFKKAMESYVPIDILYRKKQGFSLPLADWFRSVLFDKIEALTRSSLLLDTEWFNQAYLKRAVSDHRRGSADHSVMFWQLLMLHRSLENIFGQDTKVTSP